MTNTPGDGQTPQDPSSDQPGQDAQGYDQPGYWAQQQQQYGQPAYGQPPGYPAQAPQQYAPDHPRATAALVLGILGLVLCGLLAPFAWSIGKKTLTEIDASNGTLGGRGAANAGYILGIIGSIMLGLGVLFILVVVGVAVLGTFAQA